MKIRAIFQKSYVTDRQTDRPTDRPTDQPTNQLTDQLTNGWTDKASYRVACPRLRIGEIIKALQICKSSTQTASLLPNAFKSYSTLNKTFQFCFCHFYTIIK